MYSPQREDDNGVESSFTCMKKCVEVCARNAYCGSSKFWRDKICYVTVKSEEAEADGNNEEDESADLPSPSFDDILFGDNDAIYDMFDDPDAIEDMFDALDEYDIMAALQQAQGISNGVITSVRISLFAAASILLFW